MLTAAMVVLLAQAPAPVKVAVPGLGLSGIEARLGEAWVERFATLLGRDTRLKVTTRRDIETVLGLERQKQLLGCSEESSSACLAELAGGLGVDTVLSGSIVKSDSGYIVTVRVIRAKDGAEVAAASERFKTEGALVDWLEAEAARLAERVATAFGHLPAVVEPPHVERWVPAMLGAGCIAAGVALQIGARSDAASLDAGTVPVDQTAEVLQRGKTVEALSWVSLTVGVAAVAASVTWVAVGSSRATVAVVPTSGGAVLSLSGALP